MTGFTRMHRLSNDPVGFVFHNCPGLRPHLSFSTVDLSPFVRRHCGVMQDTVIFRTLPAIHCFCLPCHGKVLTSVMTNGFVVFLTQILVCRVPRLSDRKGKRSIWEICPGDAPGLVLSPLRGGARRESSTQVLLCFDPEGASSMNADTSRWHFVQASTPSVKTYQRVRNAKSWKVIVLWRLGI